MVTGYYCTCIILYTIYSIIIALGLLLTIEGIGCILVYNNSIVYCKILAGYDYSLIGLYIYYSLQIFLNAFGIFYIVVTRHNYKVQEIEEREYTRKLLTDTADNDINSFQRLYYLYKGHLQYINLYNLQQIIQLVIPTVLLQLLAIVNIGYYNNDWILSILGSISIVTNSVQGYYIFTSIDNDSRKLFDINIDMKLLTASNNTFDDIENIATDVNLWWEVEEDEQEVEEIQPKDGTRLPQIKDKEIEHIEVNDKQVEDKSPPVDCTTHRLNTIVVHSTIYPKITREFIISLCLMSSTYNLVWFIYDSLLLSIISSSATNGFYNTSKLNIILYTIAIYYRFFYTTMFIRKLSKLNKDIL